MNQPTKISAGQIYQGTATRYLFPPDSSNWWNQHGSYEIAITKVGRVWFEYEGFFVSKTGLRSPTPLPKRAKVDELLKEMNAGVMTLKAAERGPKITMEPADDV